MEKFYVHEIAAEGLSEIYFLKNAKKTCKANNRDLNRDWIIIVFLIFGRLQSLMISSMYRKTYIYLKSLGAYSEPRETSKMGVSRK